MSAENADALHVGVGVAATCLGAVCSLYTCCRHVWRRLKGYTPAVGAGAVVAAGALAAGQLTGVSTAGSPPSRGDQSACLAVPGAASSQDSGCGNQASLPSTPHTVIYFLNFVRLA
jgi:hypothetical protein